MRISDWSSDVCSSDLFERLRGLCNDVGLLAEEYDPVAGRMLGNFPQAFSHIGLINTALNLARHPGPAEERAEPQAEGGSEERRVGKGCVSKGRSRWSSYP